MSIIIGIIAVFFGFYLWFISLINRDAKSKMYCAIVTINMSRNYFDK